MDKFISINLVKSIPDPKIRQWIVNAFWGIVPADGKTRSIKNLLENQDKYAKIAESVEMRSRRSKK